MSAGLSHRVGGAPASDPSAARSTSWWNEPFRMFQTNLREVDAGMDVAKVADAIVEFGADTWLVNAGGILSFYPTELPFQTRNPYLAWRASGDLLGDAIEAAHARGLRLMARMDFSKIAEPIAQAHPEWCFVAPDGRHQVYNGLVSTCPAAGYYQEKAFEVLDEVLDRYAIDGFFFNWFGFSEVDYDGHYWGVSQSEAARRSFAEFSGGRPLPLGPESEDYDLWRTWAASVTGDLAARIRSHIARRRPDVCLVLGRSADVTFYEANNEVGRELWHHATAENVSALRTHRPEQPVLVNSVAFLDMPYRMAGEQPDHFAQYLAQTIARGGNPSTYIMGVPGDLPYADLGPAGEITRFHARHRASYGGLRPCSPVALVRADRLAQGAARLAESVAEFRGLYDALQQRHVPFDVLPVEGLADVAERDELRRFAVVVLPDLDLPPAAAAALDDYVAGGGVVVATGSSGFDAEGLAALAALPATALTHATTDPAALKGTYVVPAGQRGGVRFEGPIAPVYGAHYEVAAAPDASHHLAFLPRAPFGPPEKAYGHEPDGQPGYLRRRHGLGTGLLFPWTVGRAYHDLGLTVLRDLFVDVLVDLLGDGVVLRAELPEQVEVTLQRGPAGLVVHLLNLSGARRKSFAPQLPVTGGRLHLRGAAPGATATSLATGTACPTSADGEWLRVDLPPLDLFDVVVVPCETAPDPTEVHS